MSAALRIGVNRLLITTVILGFFASSALAEKGERICPNMNVGVEGNPINTVRVKGLSCDKVNTWILAWGGSNVKSTNGIIMIVKDGPMRGMKIQHSFVRPDLGGPLDTRNAFVMTYKGARLSFRSSEPQASINY